MNQQLMLSQKELEDLGFKSKWAAADEFNPAVSWWQFPIVNGFIVYNPSRPPYVWYLKIEIAEAANWLSLDVIEIEDLLSLFRLLKIKLDHLFNT